MRNNKKGVFLNDRGTVSVQTEETTVEPNYEELEEVTVTGYSTPTERLKNKPIDKTLRAKAFELYMTHHTWDQIVEMTGIKRGTLLSWAGKERWGSQRAENDATTLGDVMQTKKYKLNNIVMTLLDGIQKAVERDAKGGFSAKQVAVYLGALGSVEKLNRLTNGLATSISEERSKRAHFTLPLEHLKQVQEVKINDPFQIEADKEPVEEISESVETSREAGPSDGDEAP